MPRRPPPATHALATSVLSRRKELPFTRSEILAQLSKARQFTEGSKPWLVILKVQAGGTLVGTLRANGDPIVGLDHHEREVPEDGTPPGYHWDVFPVLARKERIWLEPQPASVADALDCVCLFWHVHLEPDPQMRLLP